MDIMRSFLLVSALAAATAAPAAHRVLEAAHEWAGIFELHGGESYDWIARRPRLSRRARRARGRPAAVARRLVARRRKRRRGSQRAHAARRETNQRPPWFWRRRGAVQARLGNARVRRRIVGGEDPRSEGTGAPGEPPPRPPPQVLCTPRHHPSASEGARAYDGGRSSAERGDPRRTLKYARRPRRSTARTRTRR